MSSHPDEGPHTTGERYDDARNLSALARQHPEDHRLVGPEETAVTAASLLARPPAGQQAVLSALLDCYGSGLSATDRSEVAIAFLEAYLDAVVTGPLTLLVKHGIGFEAHLQNSYVVFDDGRPTASLMSDFGAIRLNEQRLDLGSLQPYPGADIFTTEMEPVRTELWNTLFQHHIGELVGRLVATEPVSASACWSVVRQACERVFDQLRGDAVAPHRIDADRESLFGPRMAHISLTESWIRDGDGYCQTTVPNPLATATPPEA